MMVERIFDLLGVFVNDEPGVPLAIIVARLLLGVADGRFDVSNPKLLILLPLFRLVGVDVCGILVCGTIDVCRFDGDCCVVVVVVGLVDWRALVFDGGATNDWRDGVVFDGNWLLPGVDAGVAVVDNVFRFGVAGNTVAGKLYAGPKLESSRSN